MYDGVHAVSYQIYVVMTLQLINNVIIIKTTVLLPQPKERLNCIPCNSNYSMKQVIIDCVDVADVRQTFYNVHNLTDLFTNVAGDTIKKKLKKLIYMLKYKWII